MVGKDLLKILKESKYTTVLSGFEMLQENAADPLMLQPPCYFVCHIYSF